MAAPQTPTSAPKGKASSVQDLLALTESSSKIYSRHDASTFANYSEAVTTHVHLDWDVDFDARVIRGSAALVVQVLRPGTTQVHLDSSALQLQEVLLEGQQAQYAVAEKHPVLGSKISVTIPESLRTEGKQRASLCCSYNWDVPHLPSRVHYR